MMYLFNNRQKGEVYAGKKENGDGGGGVFDFGAEFVGC
jgi:hypothetical protein